MSMGGNDDMESEEVLRSPIRYMLDNRIPTLRVRLDQSNDAPGFPILDEFRRAGATDYYARIVGFSFPEAEVSRAGLVSTWTSDRPGGFTTAEIATLDRLLPRLGLSLKATLTWQIAGNVLDTYVGREAGRRILGGRIRRGQAEVIRAVVLFTDLSGFTAMSDLIPRDELLATIDAYFECMVAPIVERGGQVLKFTGDGVLAVFDDVGGEVRTDAGYVSEERRRRRIEIDADGVYRGFDDAAQRLRQRLFGHVVLVLSDADRLGIDLDQFG